MQYARIIDIQAHSALTDPAVAERLIPEAARHGVKTMVRQGDVSAFAGELGIPVLRHAWYKTVQKTKCESDPSDIADLAARIPGVKIIMAHLSGCAERGIQDVKPFPNVLVDTSGSQPVAGLVEYTVRELGADRLVYGSDVAGRDFTGQIGRILGADIAEEDRQKVLSRNAECS